MFHSFDSVISLEIQECHFSSLLGVASRVIIVRIPCLEPVGYHYSRINISRAACYLYLQAAPMNYFHFFSLSSQTYSTNLQI